MWQKMRRELEHDGQEIGGFVVDNACREESEVSL